MTIDFHSLRGALRALSERIGETVRAAKANGEIALRRQQYAIRPDRSLWYSVNPSLQNFDVETADEEVWHPKELEQFLESHIWTLPEYTMVCELVHKEDEPSTMVRRFVWRIAHEIATAGSPDVEHYINTLINDIGKKPRYVYTKIWLTGIDLVEEEIRVSDSLTLRRPTRSDLAEKVRIQDVHFIHALRPNKSDFSCVADSRMMVEDIRDYQNNVDRLVTVLRLFRLGSVSAPRYDSEFDSFSSLFIGPVSLSSPARPIRIQYKLCAEDVHALKRALEVLAPLVPTSYSDPKPEAAFLHTAFRWYGEALLSRGPLEGSVAWAVASLEALFLGDDPTTEVAYRLTQRVIALLRCFRWPALQMRKVLKLAYRVRSKHVHGANPTKLSQDELQALSRDVGEYARVSCLIWTQLLTEHSRKEVLDTLEEALLDDEAAMRLNRWCNRVNFARQGF